MTWYALSISVLPLVYVSSSSHPGVAPPQASTRHTRPATLPHPHKHPAPDLQVPLVDLSALPPGTGGTKRRGRPPKSGGVSAAAAAAANAQRAPKVGGRGPRGISLSQRDVTVPLLITMGVLKPGGVVRVVHRADAEEGTLQVDCSVVVAEGETYPDCAAFATAVKRKSAPNCRSDDGWRSCLYDGRTLHDFRMDAVEV